MNKKNTLCHNWLVNSFTQKTAWGNPQVSSLEAMIQKLKEIFETFGGLWRYLSFGERKKETFPYHTRTRHSFFLLCRTGNEVVMKSGEVNFNLDVPHLAGHLPRWLHHFEWESRQFAKARIITTYWCHPEDGNLVWLGFLIFDEADVVRPPAIQSEKGIYWDLVKIEKVVSFTTFVICFHLSPGSKPTIRRIRIPLIKLFKMQFIVTSQ